MTDTFLEYLVKKKDSPQDILLKAGIIVLAILVAIIVGLFFLAIPFLRSFVFFVILIVGYGAYILLQRRQIEYEYIFTNGDFDIDIIRGRRFRKRLVSLKCKNISSMEQIGEGDATHLKNNGVVKNINAVYNPALGGIYKMSATASGGENVNILFQPSARLAKAIYTFNPYNVKIADTVE